MPRFPVRPRETTEMLLQLSNRRLFGRVSSSSATPSLPLLTDPRGIRFSIGYQIAVSTRERVIAINRESSVRARGDTEVRRCEMQPCRLRPLERWQRGTARRASQVRR